MPSDQTRLYQVLDQVAALPGTPRHLREEIERELLPALFADLQRQRQRQARECAFWPGAEEGTWYVGDPENPGLVLGGRAQAALVAVWRALARELPSCSDVAGGSDPERAARRMVRQTAPAWATRHCPPLVGALGRILIVDGKLQYTPGGSVRVRFASAPDPRDRRAATIPETSTRTRQ